MSKPRQFVYLVAVCLAASLAATAQVEVLYVSHTGGKSLLTYNVNSETAAATEVGLTVVPAHSVAPLTVGDKRFIYVRNSTDVWTYRTDGHGVPSSLPSQDLKFGFSYPVYWFVADPEGKFAYSAYNWTDNQGNVNTDIVLFTIDHSTGKLTNTGKVVGTYGPNPYIVLDNFVFGIYGHRLYAHWTDDGPHTYGMGYYYYPVDQATGDLGKVQILYYAETLECVSSCAVAISDPTSSYAGVCCGPGSGSIAFGRNPNGKNFACENEFAFCNDDVAGLYLDPLGRNVFVGDATEGEVSVAHIDFATSQLNPTSTIPGTPQIFFSPDSRLVYALNSSDISIYTLQSSTGTLGASSSVPATAHTSIAGTTLPKT
jgi:hypothetical protein